jgi:cysteinyl-tRNA synthetase
MAELPKLRLYNTLTKAKEDFIPLDASNVRMYVCGPTVYDFAHIGNARPVIVFDVLYRLLRHLYGVKHVTYVRNITDIDDKINKRAFERWNRKGSLLDEVKALTQTTAAQYEADVAALGCLPPTHSPRATAFVCDAAQPMDMVRVIEKLVAKGHAYAAEGHVLFHVPSMPNYGKLSRRPLDDMIAGARVEVAPYKKDPMDFVLWKPSDPATEPGWDSPWGYGRPGWHIECSAMSGALLGEQFDIHAGGIDLIFPHHENEIAQSCCAFGVEKMASVWMHNGFLQVEGQKMSKSLGNFVTINELLATEKFGGRNWIGPVVRWAMLKTHYRQPIDWTVNALEDAQAEFRSFAVLVPNYAAQPAVDEIVMDALCDDLNMSEAIARLFVLRDLARGGDIGAGSRLLGSLRLLGLFNYAFSLKLSVSGHDETQAGFLSAALQQVAEDYPVDLLAEAVKHKRHQGSDLAQIMACFAKGTVVGEIKRLTIDMLIRVHKLTVDRLEARAAKNFAESDRIRNELLAMGIQLKDGKDPVTGEPVTTWEVKR